MVDFPKDVKSTKCARRSQSVFIRYDRHGIVKGTLPIVNRGESMEDMKKRGGFRTGLKESK